MSNRPRRAAAINTALKFDVERQLQTRSVEMLLTQHPPTDLIPMAKGGTLPQICYV